MNISQDLIVGKDYTMLEGKDGKKLIIIPFVIESLKIQSDPEKYFHRQKEIIKNLLSGLHSLFSSDVDNCIELSFITKPSHNQSYISDIDILLTVRFVCLATKNPHDITQEHFQICHNFFQQLHIVYHFLDMDSLMREYSGIVDYFPKCLIKEEQVIPSRTPISEFYYSVDPITAKVDQNAMDSLIHLLSNSTNVMLSIQLLPVYISEETRSNLEYLVGSLDYIVQGFHDSYYGLIRDYGAQKPLYSLQNILNASKRPLFYQAITIFGTSYYKEEIASSIKNLLNYHTEENQQIKLQEFELKEILIHSNFPTYPWDIFYGIQNRRMQTSFWRYENAPKSLFDLPHLVSLDETTVTFDFPVVKDRTLPGIRIEDNITEQSRLSERLTDTSNIQLGWRSSNLNQKVGIPFNDLSKHMFISGIPGTGKTNLSQNILWQIYQKGINFLVIEPAKTEYRAMLDIVPDLQVFTVGDSSCNPLMINPFIPPKNVPLQTYKFSLMEAFKMAFDLEETLSRVFMSTIDSCYIKHGWRDNSTKDDRVEFFGLSDFIHEFKIQMEGKYDREIHDRIETAGLMRLKNIIKKDFVLFDTVSTVSVEDILEHPTVIELNSIEDTEQKTLTIALLLISIFSFLNSNQDVQTYGKLNHVILLEEAHVLFKEYAEKENLSASLINRILAEKRASGYGLIVTDQSPSKVSEDVIKLAGNKIIFRTLDKKDREQLSFSTSMNQERFEIMMRLKVGQMLFYGQDTQIPELLNTENFREVHGIRLTISNQECKDKDHYWKDLRHDSRPYPECRLCKNCQNGCDYDIRSEGRYLSQYIYFRYIKDYKLDKDELLKILALSGDLMKSRVDPKLSIEKQNKSITCGKIKLLQEIYEDGDKSILLDLNRRLKILERIL